MTSLRMIKDTEVVKDKKEKEDLRHSIIFASMMMCVFLITGITICVNTYIHAVYELQATKTRYLRHPYYSV